MKKFNLYQIVAFIFVALGLIAGIALSIKTIDGACGYYGFMERYCEEARILFNFNIMFTVWLKTVLIGLVIYWFGDVIALLKKINEKLDKHK